MHEYADYRADLRLVIAPNNVPSNPCAYMGKALPPSAYAAQGAASNIYSSPLNFAADVASHGWTGFLNSQPLNSGTVQQNAAYGNYVFGVYMQTAGLTLSKSLSGANAFAAYRKGSNPNQYAGQQMDPNYPSLPVQNVGGWPVCPEKSRSIQAGSQI